MIENKYVVPIFGIIALFGLLFVSRYFYSSFNDLYESTSLTSSTDFWTNNKLRLHANESLELQHSLFPRKVHQMWKSNSIPPKETLKWRSGCQALNPFHDFNMMDDHDLKEFVHINYPEYAPLFNALKGVYMADMARFIVAYHYGGVYLDLDFYCRRPLLCLEEYSLAHVSQLMKRPLSKTELQSDIFVVSRESRLHSQFIHNSSRIVIQDFFLSTPRHPFVKWFLDSRATAFAADPSLAKSGPFSYHINDALDEYYRHAHASVIHGNGSSSSLAWAQTNTFGGGKSGGDKHHRRRLEAPSKVSFILELPADVLHPLADSTNSRIGAACTAVLKAGPSHPFYADCAHFDKGEYLQATPDTILVHMWTHTFLGWSMLRGLYNSGVYKMVEKSLPPLTHCNREA